MYSKSHQKYQPPRKVSVTPDAPATLTRHDPPPTTTEPLERPAEKASSSRPTLGPTLLGIAALAVALGAWVSTAIQWKTTEELSQPSLHATVAGWYQFGLDLQMPGQLDDVSAKGVPVLVSVLQNVVGHWLLHSPPRTTA